VERRGAMMRADGALCIGYANEHTHL